MLSKNQFKFIKNLRRKKYRVEQKLFLTEGVKVVEEFLESNFNLFKLYHTKDYIVKHKEKNVQVITDKELKSISDFSTPNKVIGIFEIPDQSKIQIQGLTLVLDHINDPGNLGTIIRLCDWFGIEQLICSMHTVDCYNPKVVQASMGSLSRVSLVYRDIEEYLKQENRTVYGTFLDGKNVYKEKLEKNAVLILGNESNGIRTEIEKRITSKLTIPQFGNVKRTESLNVATATAILLSEFKR